MEVQCPLRRHSPNPIPGDVRFGSKTDICIATRHVRFTPDSDRESEISHDCLARVPWLSGCRVNPPVASDWISTLMLLVLPDLSDEAGVLLHETISRGIGYAGFVVGRPATTNLRHRGRFTPESRHVRRTRCLLSANSGLLSLANKNPGFVCRGIWHLKCRGDDSLNTQPEGPRAQLRG